MPHIGLIIGRFQPLHKGHLLLIETSLKENPATLILLGSIQKTDEDNPYSYELRKKMIQDELGEEKIFLGGLTDTPNDSKWIEQILQYIPENATHCTLYCGDKEHDSAVLSILDNKDIFPFGVDIIEIPRSIIPISATQIRKWISKKNMGELKKYIGEKTLEKIIQ